MCLELYHDIYNENLPPRKKFIRVVVGIAAPIHIAIQNAKTPVEAKDIDLQNEEIKERAKIIRLHISKNLKNEI